MEISSLGNYLLSFNLFAVNACLLSNGQGPGPASTVLFVTHSTAGPILFSFTVK